MPQQNAAYDVFTSVAHVTQAVLFLSAFPDTAFTGGLSLVASHSWFMQSFDRRPEKESCNDRTQYQTGTCGSTWRR